MYKHGLRLVVFCRGLAMGQFHHGYFTHAFCMIALLANKSYQFAKAGRTTTTKQSTTHGSALIQAWLHNYIHYNERHEIIYQFPNFNDTVEVRERISSFILHFIKDIITHPC